MKSDRVNLVAPASPVHRAGTVQTGTGMVDPARIFKCTAAARGECSTFSLNVHSILTLVQSFFLLLSFGPIFVVKMLCYRNYKRNFKLPPASMDR